MPLDEQVRLTSQKLRVGVGADDDGEDDLDDMDDMEGEFVEEVLEFNLSDPIQRAEFERLAAEVRGEG